MIATVIFGDSYQQTGQLIRILSPILFLKTISFASAARSPVESPVVSAVIVVGANRLIFPARRDSGGAGFSHPAVVIRMPVRTHMENFIDVVPS